MRVRLSAKVMPHGQVLQGMHDVGWLRCLWGSVQYTGSRISRATLSCWIEPHPSYQPVPWQLARGAYSPFYWHWGRMQSRCRIGYTGGFPRRRANRRPRLQNCRCPLLLISMVHLPYYNSFEAFNKIGYRLFLLLLLAQVTILQADLLP